MKWDGEVSCTFFRSHINMPLIGLPGSFYLYGKGEDISLPIDTREGKLIRGLWLIVRVGPGRAIYRVYGMACGCPERSTITVKGRTYALAGLPIGYRTGQTYKRVGMQGREDGQWLAWIFNGPHTKEVWTRKYARLVTKISSLMSKVTHLYRLHQIMVCHSLFRVWSCERYRKGAPWSSRHTVKAGGHRSSE
jgi:hypothetical protein